MTPPEIGKLDENGNLLILGGWHGKIVRTPKGIFKVNEKAFLNPGEAVDAYNEANNTKLDRDYIENWFLPWYQKTYGGRSTLTVQSGTSDKTYDVSIDEYGQVSCTCKGFTYRGKCRHSDAVKELLGK